MIDIKRILNEPEFVRENIRKRNKNIDIDGIIEKVKNSNELKQIIDEKRSEKKKKSELFRQFKDDPAEIERIKNDIATIDRDLEKYTKEYEILDEQKKEMLLRIPNILLSDVPEGKDESDNRLISQTGTVPAFDFEPSSHIDIGEKRGILDLKASSHLSGSRFTFLSGKGATLYRALGNFMVTEHIKSGYEEIFAPFMVRKEILIGSGQIPDKEEDLYKIQDSDMYMIPTSEVTLVNYCSTLNIQENDLPKRFVSYSSCFRKEAGSYGQDTQGMIRLHQFEKVELVSVVKPDEGEQELEKLLNDACCILKKLGLTYRVVILCSGDTGFTCAKTYDIEVYMPSQKRFREVSSVSLCTDFQSRRLNLKYKKENGEKDLLHTLNGSALAIGRTFIAIIENFQDKEGNINIPEVLIPFTGFSVI